MMKMIKVAAFFFLKNKMRHNNESNFYGTRPQNIINSFLLPTSLPSAHICIQTSHSTKQVTNCTTFTCNLIVKEGLTRFNHELTTLGIASDLIGNYYSLDCNIIGSFVT